MQASSPQKAALWARACVPAWLSLMLLALPGCAGPGTAPTQAEQAWQARLADWQDAQALLLGEQHDADAHQRWEADTVRWLAARGRLAALVIEMAEAGSGTDGLPPGASAAQVRAALHWNEDAWPWQNYGPVIMAAVAADVPVRGGNLPLGRMRAAMQDEALDAHLPPAQLELQRQAIADGHCGLLPAERLMPMVRIQLARDASLAQAVLDARQNGRTVLLVAGWGHVRSDLGVPTWLPPELKVKTVIAQAGKALEATETEANYMYATPALAPRDHCAELRAHPPASMAPVRR